VCRLRLPRRAPRNVAHESTVTHPQSASSANAIPNFPEADLNEAASRQTLSRAIIYLRNHVSGVDNGLQG
jgi:hypothetical protein